MCVTFLIKNRKITGPKNTYKTHKFCAHIIKNSIFCKFFVCIKKLHVPPYVTFEILHFMEIEETIAKSEGNQQQLVLALQEKLRDFGLTKNESKIYVYLSKAGPQKAIEISRNENIPRTETYHLLSNLELKGIVMPSVQKPTRFSAVTIEEAIESIIRNQEKRIKELKILKDDMIALWNSFQSIRKYSKSDLSKFESAMRKYAKADRMRKEFRNNIRKMKSKSDMLDN